MSDGQTLQRITSHDPHLDANALFDVVEPVLRGHGFEAVEVSFQRERQGWVLRVTIEDPRSTQAGAGVNLDECAEVSRGLSRALDEVDLVKQAYHLEVGTPGVERPLFDARDYARFVGHRCKVVLSRALADGQRAVQATIEGAAGAAEVTGSGASAGEESGGWVGLRLDGGKSVRVPLESIKSGHLVFEPPRGEKASKVHGASRGAEGGARGGLRGGKSRDSKASKSNEGGG